MTEPSSRDPPSAVTDPLDVETRVEAHRIAAAEIRSGSHHLASVARGTALGRYVVLDELGAGGMGRVVKAYDSRLHREVALKLVRLDPRHDELAVRLEREAQALACLSHPNVVAVFDVDRESAELLYLAMEYVPGMTLRQWLRAGERRIDELVAVFVQAGRGLAAAHAAGLVHRDFKPSNVMIGDDGRVRVTDFGLARVTADWEPVSTDAPSFEPLAQDVTQAGLVVGTPAYMPPEQHTGAAMDPRGDQYSFCVALYEALCGQRPFMAPNATDLLLEKLEGPPAFPAHRAVPAWLQAVVRRGLAARPEQRWPSMDALLGALLDDPARARRRWLVRVGVVGAVAASLGAGGLAVGLRPEPCPRADERLAGVWDEPTRERLRQAVVATGLGYAEDTWTRIDDGLATYADAWLLAHHDACVATAIRHEQSSELLDRRMLCLERARLALRATVEALSVVDPAIAERGVRAVHELPELSHCADLERLAELAPPDDPALAARVEQGYARLHELAALRATGQYRRAAAELEPLVVELEALGYLPLTAAAHELRAFLLDQLGHHEEALQAAERSFALALESRADHVALEVTMDIDWLLAGRLRRFDDALRWNAAGAALARRLGEPDARFLGARASNLRLLGRLAEAEALFLATLPRLPDDHPALAVYLNDLGNLYMDQGRYREALERYQQAHAHWSAMFGPEHPDTVGALVNIGSTLAAMGQLEEAERELRRVIVLWTSAYGADNPAVAHAELELGLVLLAMGRLDEAEAEITRALEKRRRLLGREHPEVARALQALADVALARGRASDAEALLREAVALFEAVMPKEHPDLVPLLLRLAAAIEPRGGDDETKALRVRAAEIARAALPPESALRREAERGAAGEDAGGAGGREDP